jgi:2,4'-dihydroxyacetophenone dioxygenase
MPLAPIFPTARHVAMDDVPWVQNPRVDSRMRILQADLDDNFYVIHGIMPSGLDVPTHRHRGIVHGFTLSGAWTYREYDFVNRAGSYLFEPADSVHTLHVLEGPSETLFVIYGDTEYLDADGVITSVSNARVMLDSYYEACERAGIPRPNGILL